MPFTRFGPGTITLGETATACDFTCEVLGFEITHDYSDIGQARTTLCGDVRGATVNETGSIKFTLENDLGADGFYAWVQDQDPSVAVPFVFTPNTADGASWSGDVLPRKPNVKADEYGAPIGGDVTFPLVGVPVFTPSTPAGAQL